MNLFWSATSVHTVWERSPLYDSLRSVPNLSCHYRSCHSLLHCSNPPSPDPPPTSLHTCSHFPHQPSVGCLLCFLSLLLCLHDPLPDLVLDKFTGLRVNVHFSLFSCSSLGHASIRSSQDQDPFASVPFFVTSKSLRWKIPNLDDWLKAILVQSSFLNCLALFSLFVFAGSTFTTATSDDSLPDCLHSWPEFTVWCLWLHSERKQKLELDIKERRKTKHPDRPHRESKKLQTRSSGRQ